MKNHVVHPVQIIITDLLSALNTVVFVFQNKKEELASARIETVLFQVEGNIKGGG